MPNRLLNHDSYEHHGELSSEEIAALRLPLAALSRNIQIEIGNARSFDGNTWTHDLPRKSVVDVLDETKKFFEDDV